MNRSRILCFALSLVLIALLHASVGGQAPPSITSSFTRDVSALTNIFAAGQPDAGAEGGGYAPASIPLTPGKGRFLTLPSATGDASCCGPDPLKQAGRHGPDGNKNPFPSTDIRGTNHLSGIIHKDRILFLAGVFLSDDYAHDPTPPVLKYSLDGRTAGSDKTIPTSFTDFAPALNQVFFVGDGNSGDNPASGVPQRFHIPDGATRFYMGYADGLNIGSGTGGIAPNQPPGYYTDNAGGAHVVVQVNAPTEPARPPRYAVADLGSLNFNTQAKLFLGTSVGMALNDNGQVVGWSDTFSGARHAFFFNGGYMLDMGTMGGDSIATGISNMGSIVGYSQPDISFSTAFLHDFQHPVQILQSPLDILFASSPGFSIINSRANAINIVPRTANQSFSAADLPTLTETVGAYGSNPTHAYEKTDYTGLFKILDLGSGGEFYAIGGVDAKAGFINVDGAQHACASLDGIVDIQSLLKQQMGVPDGNSIAYGISHYSHLVGAYDSAPDGSSSRAFLYDVDANKVQDLAYGSAGPYYAFGINKNDVAVGSDTPRDDLNHGKALLFQNNRVYDLNGQIEPASGWTLQKAFAINNRGQITGVGIAPSGQQHAFLMTPLPKRAPPRLYPMSPSRVLVVANSDSKASLELANYYMHARNIPSSNLCQIKCPETEDIPYNSKDGKDYFRIIAKPIGNFITANNLHVDHIVLMKGVPLRADVQYGVIERPDQDGQPTNKSAIGLSVTSLLTTLDIDIPESDIPRVTNPYYKGPQAHNVYAALGPNANSSYARFRHDSGGLYLVTRLDAYTFKRCHDLVDWSMHPNVKDGWFLTQPDIPFHTWRAFGDVDDQMGNAQDLLVSKGLNSSLDYQYAYPQGANIVGYNTYGSNHHAYAADGHSNTFLDLYYGTPETQAAARNDTFVSAFLNTTFRPGSIATMQVSFSGRTFLLPPSIFPTGLKQDQPLIGDLIERGATGVQGFVDEPGGDAIAHSDILFDSYTAGYGIAEAFYMASRYVYHMETVVGDPLCAPYAYATTAQDYTNATVTKKAGFVKNRGITHVFQKILVTTLDPIPGPVTLVLSNLAPGTELVNRTGLTMGGEPYITLSPTSLGANTQKSVQLEISRIDLNYTVSVIAKPGAR